MSRLSTYKAKRRFTDTPEPKPKVKKSENEHIFVVHKHYASHLHYDLRLEIDGVLKSWAVPKGFPFEKNEKRLAIMTEDHPYDYKDFHGVIPKGNYGAGVVEIWDHGIFLGAKEQNIFDLKKALKKGHLHFFLHGKRLLGEYSLVKIASSKNEWLLIKMEGRAFKKKKAPQKISPMLAKLVTKPFNHKDWLFEIKWDGYRTIAKILQGEVKLSSRNQLSFNKKFSPIVDQLKKHIHHDAILDGEVVAINDQGQPDFSLLKSGKAQAQSLIFYAFDLLYLDGQDLRDHPLIERKEKLEILLAPLKNTNIKYCDHIIGQGEQFFKKAESYGLEGIIAKKIHSVYTGKRSDEWLKIKVSRSEVAIIGGFTQSKGKAPFGALLLGKKSRDGFTYIGKVGTGFSAEAMEYIMKKLKPLIRKTKPFELPKGIETNCIFVRPQLKCLVSFTEWTNAGLMRHPVFHRLRKTKE